MGDRRGRILPTWILLGSVGLALIGCGGGGRDGGPTRRVDLSRVADAVPRVEPRSRYGNSRSYVVHGKRYYTLDSSSGYRERGIASWYGSKFHGRRTSSGEPYDMYAMTAAHRRLPLPTYARVTNLRNGRSVVVRVNDRGPFHDNRIIDLSYVAAAKLDIVRTGTGLVEVAAIDPAQPEPPAPQRPPPLPAAAPVVVERPATTTKPVAAMEPQLFLQVGAFGSRFNAERLRERVASRVDGPIRVRKVERARRSVYRVQIGPLDSVERVDSLSERLQGLGLDGMHVVIE